MAGFSRFVLARRPHRSPYSLLFRRTSVLLFHDFFRQYAFDIEETNRLFFFLSSVAETSHTLFRQGNGKTAIKKSFCPCLEIGNCGRIKPQGENTNPSRSFPLFSSRALSCRRLKNGKPSAFRLPAKRRTNCKTFQRTFS